MTVFIANFALWENTAKHYLKQYAEMKNVIFKAIVSIALFLTAIGASAQGGAKWENVDYAGDGIVGHRMDIYLPDDTVSRHKVIILIYGSAWFSNSAKADAFRQLGRPLLDAGFAVVSVNHRASTEAKFPAQVNDVKAAVRYVRAHAAEYRLDTSFIGVTGYSSGGHLSSFLGTTNGVRTYGAGDKVIDIEGCVGSCLDSSSSVDAVVDWFGPVDMSRMENCSTVKDGKSPEAVLLGCPPASNPGLVAALSPINHVAESGPMFLVIHGNSDPVVPYCQSVFFSDVLKAKGRLADFITVEGGQHGPVTFNADTMQRMTDFFKAQADRKK